MNNSCQGAAESLTGSLLLFGLREIGHFAFPAYRAFAHAGFHEHSLTGRFNTDQIAEELGSLVFRTQSSDRPSPHDRSKCFIQRVLIRFEEQTWAICDGDSIHTISTDPERARHQAKELARRFAMPAETEESLFYILSVRDGELNAEPVAVERSPVINREELAMHYGPSFPDWETSLLIQLGTNLSGIALFRGEPGTGKTTYIRRLIRVMRDTHRIYYLPASMARVLGSPETAAFWLRENNRQDGCRNAVIIEDAESLLEERTGDNRASLENLLNVSDGLMGDFLKVVVIATINCPVGKLDPAITRPGRLLAFRNFERLNPEQARKLAQHKGLSLPEQESYSLAEIYSKARVEGIETTGKRLGFAV